MKAVSELIEIVNNHSPSVEYIEEELKKLHINSLRWAIVDVSDKMYTVSITKILED